MTLFKYRSALLFFSVACFLLFAATSCKKKSDSVSLPITGTWKPVSDTSYAYLVFGNNSTLTGLRQTTIGIHIAVSGIYSADGEQVTYTLGGGSSQLFNYHISNDSLYLVNAGSYVVLVKSNTVDVNTWTRKISLLESHALGKGLWFGAMDWDGTSFLISSSYAHKIYKVGTGSYTVNDSTAVTQKGGGIAVVGSNIWLTNYNLDKALHIIDFSTGNAIFNSSDCGGYPLMLGADNGNILVFTSNSDIYLYNIATDSYTFMHSLAGTDFTGLGIPPDMVIKDGYAFITYGGFIIKLDLASYQVVDTYQSDTGDYYTGITYDGTNFYTLSITLGSTINDLNAHLNKVQLQ